MSHDDTLSGPPWPPADAGPLTLGGLLRDVHDRFPDHEALVFDDPLRGGETVRWTYDELWSQARRVAAALLATGNGKGARVGILMGNRPEAVAAVFGTALAGGTAVPLSTLSPKPELSYLLQHADVRTLLVQAAMGDRDFAGDIAELVPSLSGPGPIAEPEHPHLRHVVVLGATGAVTTGTAADGWDDFLARGDDWAHLVDAAAEQVHASDHGVIVYSSGTTDRPKGVLHSQQSVTWQCHVQAGLWGRDDRTRVLCSLPMFWTAGLNTAMGATVAAGGCWVMQERFEPGEALRLITRERVTEPHGMPPQYAAIEEHPDFAAADLSSCVKVAGKPVFEHHPSTAPDPDWHTPVGYGASETCSMFTGLPASSTPDEFARRSHGRLLPGNQLRVLDPATGEILGPGREGELALRGPTLMEHYVKRARHECLDADGFYRTGDLGHYDEDGFVYWAGRGNDMIKTSGALVSPAEIELQLRSHPAVRLSRAIGVPDERRDEIVVLCVELADGATATEDELRDHLRERLASYKVPRRVVFFEAGGIPMTGNGVKVKADELLALVQAELGVGA